MLEKLTYNFAIAAEAIGHNRVRALLTSLGIIFGVASVISMLAIGRGAQQEILEQIRLLGATNVIVTPTTEQEEGRVGEEATESADGEGDGEVGPDGRPARRRPYSPGLTLADARSIEAHVPGVVSVSPEIVAETVALRAGLRRSTRLVGVGPAYFDEGPHALAEGRLFTAQHFADAAPVCLIGAKAKTRFFPKDEPVGGRIKVGGVWFTVVGVLKERSVSAQSLEHLGLRDTNLDIYTPIDTYLLRYENRALLTSMDLQRAREDERRGEATSSDEGYHQLDRLVIRTAGPDYVAPVANVVSRMLERRHLGVVDYEVVIPEVLLQQERRTQTIFNVVLAAIASISLIVGGIGIMNIMLASVMERIKEIGIRRSIGATRQDVVIQFLIEAITISFTGGVIGILLGVGLSLVIEAATGIRTLVTLWAVLLSFVVSVTVGLVFGLLPARRASEHDPVVALRYE